MEKTLIIKITLGIILLWIFTILYRSKRIVKKDYMEELLAQTRKVKGQWDK